MINLILADTLRSKIYLKLLFKNNIKINKILFYGTKKAFFKNVNFSKTKKFFVNARKIDNPKIYNMVKKLGNYDVIFSGYPGEIVKNHKLFNYNLIHAHPGNLPYFKGSTTLYYTILNKKKITVSVIRLNKFIDEGKILFKKNFEYPKNIRDIEGKYDAIIRIKTIIQMLKQKNKNKQKKINSNVNGKIYKPYYIAHPILRMMAMNRQKLKRIYKKYI